MIYERLWASRPSWREAILFSLVGAANTATYILAAVLLAYVAGMRTVIASSLAYVLAVAVAFLGNAIFTFEKGRWNSPRQWIAYSVLYGLGLVWNVSAIHIFETLTGSPIIGFVAFSLTWPVLAFVISKTFVFRD